MGPDTISSHTNTFASLVPGVDVTLGSGALGGTAVTVGIATDTTSMSQTVKGLVDQLNGVLSDIDSATRTGTGTTKGGALAGDTGLRSLRDELVGSLYSDAGSGLAAVGVQLDRYGKFVFDESKFKAAYQSDPAATAARFTKGATSSGFADRLAVVADRASRSSDGTLGSMVKGRTKTIDRLNSSITDWDMRLELRRTTLTRQFTALETALNKMNSQSSWLSGQIAQLSNG
jgi:flagellar hook-associated protein 2